jgi:hypothetical protein
VWLPFYAHCAVEAHCHRACATMGEEHCEMPCGDEHHGEDAEPCHDHDTAYAPMQKVFLPALVCVMCAWVSDVLVAPPLVSKAVVPSARAPDESPPPHLWYAVAAHPVRGPSIA